VLPETIVFAQDTMGDGPPEGDPEHFLSQSLRVNFVGEIPFGLV